MRQKNPFPCFANQDVKKHSQSFRSGYASCVSGCGSSCRRSLHLPEKNKLEEQNDKGNCSKENAAYQQYRLHHASDDRKRFAKRKLYRFLLLAAGRIRFRAACGISGHTVDIHRRNHAAVVIVIVPFCHVYLLSNPGWWDYLPFFSSFIIASNSACRSAVLYRWHAQK